MGAGIWMTGMGRLEEEGGMVGLEFESIDDHAGYLRAGGCSQIIEVLAGL